MKVVTVYSLQLIKMELDFNTQMSFPGRAILPLSNHTREAPEIRNKSNGWMKYGSKAPILSQDRLV